MCGTVCVSHYYFGGTNQTYTNKDHFHRGHYYLIFLCGIFPMTIFLVPATRNYFCNNVCENGRKSNIYKVKNMQTRVNIQQEQGALNKTLLLFYYKINESKYQ